MKRIQPLSKVENIIKRKALKDSFHQFFLKVRKKLKFLDKTCKNSQNEVGSFGLTKQPNRLRSKKASGNKGILLYTKINPGNNVPLRTPLTDVASYFQTNL